MSRVQDTPELDNISIETVYPTKTYDAKTSEHRPVSTSQAQASFQEWEMQVSYIYAKIKDKQSTLFTAITPTRLCLLPSIPNCPCTTKPSQEIFI
jgi:hypothetical protein